MIKLIASDIDGTLLSETARRIDPRLFQLIRAFRKRGIARMLTRAAQDYGKAEGMASLTVCWAIRFTLRLLCLRQRLARRRWCSVITAITTSVIAAPVPFRNCGNCSPVMA